MGEGNLEMSGSIVGANMAGLRVSTRAALATLLVGLAALLVCVSPASALSQHGHEFKEAFTFEQAGKDALAKPSAIAVDEASGDIYVLDRSNNRVVRFGPEHEFLQAWGYGVSKAGGETYETCEAVEASECHAGIPGYKKEQFDTPVAIAVDNATKSKSYGDVYVVANGSWRKPVVDKFSPSGVLVGKLIGRKEEKEETEGAIEGVAVDGTGDVWIEREDEGREFLLQRFNDEEDNKLLNSEELELPKVSSESDPLKPGFGVDANGGVVYVTYEPGGTPLPVEEEEIKEREEERKEHKEKLGTPEQPQPPCTAHTCLAAQIEILPTGGGLEEETLQADFGQETLPALSQPSATGLAVDDSSGGQSSGDVYLDHATTVASFSSANSLIQEFGSEELEKNAGGAGLAVDARTGGVLLAEAASSKIEVYQPSVPGPPVIEAGSVAASDVTSTSADLTATIDPDGVETRYRFEYGTESCAEHEQSCTEIPAPPIAAASLGAGFGDEPAVQAISGLVPETTYYVRAIAERAGSSEPVYSSEEATFKTASAVPPSPLLDGRAWEQVSPVLKHGSSLEAIAEEGGVIEAAAAGDAVTYLASGPFGESEPESNDAPEPAQIVSARKLGSTGWSSQDVAAPEDAERTQGYNPGRERQYEVFTPELTEAILNPYGEVPLSVGTTEKTIYLRNSLAPCVVPSACFEPLIDAGDDTATPQAAFAGKLFFEGASPDLQHVILRSQPPLTENAPENSLYEWSAGKLQLISWLPGGQPAVHEAYLGSGERYEMRSTAVSGNGERVVFSAQAEEGKQLDKHLFDRNVATQETVQVDEPDTGVTPSSEKVEPLPTFQIASADGSKVFFTDDQRLTTDSTAPEETTHPAESPLDLYVSEPDKPAGERVHDLTPVLNHGEAAGVQGAVLGIGEEGSEMNVYFVADGVLAAGAQAGDCYPEAPPGAAACNLYVEHYTGTGWQEPRFIARLSDADHPDWGAEIGEEVRLYNLLNKTSRVSPNGGYLAFMSDQRLTKYDNSDAVSGAPDEEVFRYEYKSGEIVCVSCNPNGTRPTGVHDIENAGEGKGLLIDRPETWAETANGENTDHWLAANVPGWTFTGSTVGFYQSRYLLNDGRLFFNSPSPLVRQATNEKADVYEYEPVGLGTCAAASENAQNGCLALISSGESEHESAFLDASDSGNDVFFLTASKLSPFDEDTDDDVYDARVCEGTMEPCPSTAVPTPEPPCSSEACKPPYSPPSTSSGSPASTSSSGSGNIQVLGVKESKPPVKKLSKAQLLANALKSCKRDKRKSKRVACEKQARRKYGAKQSSKKASVKR
jgi:hypothetical protein